MHYMPTIILALAAVVTAAPKPVSNIEISPSTLLRRTGELCAVAHDGKSAHPLLVFLCRYLTF